MPIFYRLSHQLLNFPTKLGICNMHITLFDPEKMLCIKQKCPASIKLAGQGLILRAT